MVHERWLAGGLLLGLVVLGVELLPLQAQDERERDGTEAARMFENRCASCHVVPDPNYATDQAWLDRIDHTA